MTCTPDSIEKAEARVERCAYPAVQLAELIGRVRRMDAMRAALHKGVVSAAESRP